MPTEISNGESGLSVRNKLNTLFSDFEGQVNQDLRTTASPTFNNLTLSGRFLSADFVSYTTRPNLVSDWTNGLYADGTIISDGTVFYKAVSGSSIIPDLLGLVPFDPSGEYDAFVEHFIATSDTTPVDITSALQLAVDYVLSLGGGIYGVGGKLGLKSREYNIADNDGDGYGVLIGNQTVADDNSITIKGTGFNSTTLRINTNTDTMFYVGRGNSLTDPGGSDFILNTASNASSIIRGITFEGIQFINLSSTGPTSGCFVECDRSSVDFKSVRMINHFTAIKMLGNPENCRFIDSEIIQGSNQYALLNYDGMSSAFTVGETITGATSGATATVIADSNDGTSGLLTILPLNGSFTQGPFEDNETINGSLTGIAVVNGPPRARPRSCGILIERRRVNPALRTSIAYADDVTLNYDGQTNNFVVGGTIHGATSGAIATVIADSDSGTSGTLTINITNNINFQDNETISSAAGGSGTVYALANGTNTEITYWTEPNAVFISNSNIEMGSSQNHYGGQHAILITCGDTIAIQNSHIAWGSLSCIGIVPSQRNMSLSDIRVEGGLIDPLPNKTKNGLYIADDNLVGSTTIGSVSLSNLAISGVTLGTGVRVAVDINRLTLTGVEMKQCGTYGLVVNDANAKNIIVQGCNFFWTNQLGGTTAAVYIVNGEKISFVGNNFMTGFRGIQLDTNADRVTIVGNTFDGMSSGTSIYLPTSLAGEVTISGNDVDESFSFAAANRLYIPVGLDYIHLTGTTPIYEIRADAPFNSAYPGRKVTATFADAVTIYDDAATPGGAIVPNLRISADITTGTGHVVEFIYAPDVESGKWVVGSVRANT